MHYTQNHTIKYSKKNFTKNGFGILHLSIPEVNDNFLILQMKEDMRNVSEKSTQRTKRHKTMMVMFWE